jgi:hypothetical protein
VEDTQALISLMAQTNNELCAALRTAHDHLLMNNQTHTRTYKIVKQALDKYDHETQVKNHVD